MSRGRRKEFETNALVIWQAVKLKQCKVRSASRLVARDINRSGEWKLTAERIRKICAAFEKRMANDAELRDFASRSLATIKVEWARWRAPDIVLIPRRLKWLSKRHYGYTAMNDPRAVAAFTVSLKKTD